MNLRPPRLGSAACFGVVITLAAGAFDPAVHDAYLTPKEYALLLASAGAVVLWTVVGRKAIGGSLRFTAIEAILAASILWGLIASPHWVAMRKGNQFWPLLAGLVLTVVVRQLFNPPKDDDARGEPGVRTIALADLMVAIWVVGSALAIHGLAQALAAGSFQPADGSTKTTVISIIGTENGFGAFMAAGIIAAVTLASQARRGPVRLLLAGGGLLQLVALLGNRSRGAVLGLVAAGLVILLLKTHGWRGRRVGVAVLGVLVVIAVAGVLLHRLNPGSGRARLVAWQISGAMVSDRPFTGVGPGRYAREYDGYQAEFWRHPDYAEFDHRAAPRMKANSEPIQRLAEQGLPGGAFYLLLWACALGFLLRALLRREGTSPFDRGLLALLVAILVHSLVDNVLQWTATLVIAHLGFGLLPAPVVFRADLRRARVRKLATGVAVAWTAVVAVKTGWEYSGYKLWVDARQPRADGLEILKRAHQRLPSEPDLSYGLGVGLLRVGQPEQAAVVLQRGIEARDRDDLRLALAEALLELGWVDQAELNARKAAAGYPDRLRPRLMLARIHHAKGEDAQARSALASCIRRDTYYRSALVDAVVKEATLLWRSWYDDEPPH